MGIRNRNTTRPLLACSAKARRKSIATAVDRIIVSKNSADHFLFEPLEPRILLSADGVMPIPPEMDLQDVVSDTESTDASLATISESLSDQVPETESGALNPEQDTQVQSEEPLTENTSALTSPNVEPEGLSMSVSASDAIAQEQVEPSDAGSSVILDSESLSDGFSSDESLHTDEQGSTSDEDTNTNGVDPIADSLITESEVTLESEASSRVGSDAQSVEEQAPFVAANASLQTLEDSPADVQLVFIDLSIDGYEGLLEGIDTQGAELVFIDPPADFDVEKASESLDESSSVDAPMSTTPLMNGAGDSLTAHLTESQAEQQAQIVVYFIDPSENGVEKIANSLANYDDVDAVHILSHGAAGAVNLGNTRLTHDNVAKYRNELESWGGSLEQGADILFYGCEVGANHDGLSLLKDVSDITGADVSASDDDTGNVSLGGDYDLEVSVGEVQVQALFAMDAELQFSSLLAPTNVVFTVTSGNNAISITNDGTNILISDGVAANDVSTLIGDVLDITITGIDGEADALTIDLGTEFFIDIAFDGGVGAGDSIAIINGSYADVTYTATGAQAGSISVVDDVVAANTNTMTYSNVDAISDASSADNRTFEGLATADDITVQNAAVGQATIQATNSADITFDNPTDSLTINTGDGDDVIAVTADQLMPTNGIAINAGAGSDSLTLDLTNGLVDIDFDGGTTVAGDNDSLAITNGTYEAVVYSASADANSGDIEFFATSGGAVSDAVSYSHVDSISDASTADDRTFVGSDNADQITLIDGAVAGQSQIQDAAAAGSNTFVDIDFNNPVDSLSIESGQGDDVITIAANQDAGFAPTNGLDIDAGTGSDTVAVDLASGLIDADFDGGTIAAGDNDSLSITNGTYDSVVYSDGQVEFSMGAATDTLIYTNFNTISDDIAATDRTFIGTTGVDQITLTDVGGPADGRSQIQSTTSADVTFNNPTASLTIQAGEGDDDIIIDASQDDALNPSAGITVEGGEGADTLSVDLTTDFLVDIAFDGGTNMMGAENDAIAITNGTFSSVVYSADNVSAASGSVEFFDETTTTQSNTITYSNLETVTDDSDAVGRTFIGTNAADAITIVDADLATVGQTRIQDDAATKTFADITFKGPSEFLRVEGGNGADTIRLEAGQDAGLSPEKAVGATQQNSGILIDGGADSDTVTVDGDADFMVNIINSEALTINGTVLDESSEIAGLDALITFLQSLESNGAFGVDFPLSGSGTPGSASFGSVSGVTEVLQQLRDDIAADATARGDLDAFLATWTAVVSSAQGDVTISTSNVTDTVVTVDDQAFEVSNSLEIDASRTTTVDIDNVEVLNEANVGFTPNPANPNYTVDIQSDLDFIFGTNEDGFFTEINTFNVNYADSGTTPIALDGSLQIGVLGADITGTALNLNADIALTFDDPNNDGAQISIAELNAANAMGGDRDALVNFEAQGEFALTLDFTPQDSFAPALAGTIQVGGDGVLGNGNSYDIFTDYAQGAPVDLMSDDLRGISLLSAEKLIEPLNDFALFLERLTDSGLYDGNLLLTDGARVGDLLEYTELLRAEVISDVSNLVLDADRNIARNADGTPVGDGSPTIATIQEFQALFDPSQVSFSYDSANNTLGIAVSLSEQRITEADFDYNIILESLEELQALSTAVDTSTTPTTTTVTDLNVDVDTTLGLDFTFEFNLQAIDTPVLEPSSALASAQTGQLANDAQFELTVGGETRLVTIDASATSTNMSLADLIVDINQALDASFTATVTASLDESSGTEFPRLSFSSGAGAISVDDLSRIDTGVVTEDSSISVSINDSVTPSNSQGHTISLLAADTVGNASLSDLVVDINAAIDAEFGANVITAALDASGQRIELSLDGAPANQTLNINNLNFLVEDQKVENPAIDVLGLTVGPLASSAFGILNTLPDVDVSAAGVDIEFALELDAVRTANFTVAAADTAGLSSAADLVTLFNAQLSGIDVTAVVENGRLVFAADDGSGITSLRIIAEPDNPISTVLGFSSGQGAISKELAPAYFDTNETSIDATVRTSFSQTGTTTTVSGSTTTTEGVTARYGFVDIDFTEVAAQSTMTLSTSLMDADDQVDITQLNDSLGSIVDGPIVSGALSDTLGDDDYVANDNLRSLVTASAGDIQFAVYLDGYAAGESQTAEHRLTISATLPFVFGESDLGLGDNSQSIVSGQLANTVLETGTVSGVANFNLTVAGTDTLNVSVDTTGNTSSTDLISDINTAIDAEITRLTTAAAGNSAQILQLQSYDIQVNIIDGALVFQEANNLLLELLIPNTVAANELNLTDANGSERLIFTDLFDNLAIDTEGRPRADVALALQIDNNPAVTITLDQIDTSDNIDLIDLVTDINAALALTSLATTVEARVVASRLALVNLGPANTQLSVSSEPLSVTVEGDSRSTFISVNAEIIKDALSNFADVLEQTDFAEGDTGRTSFLDEILPIIGQSGLDLNDYITAFSTFVTEVNNLNADSLQELERGINELMGLNHDVVNADTATGLTAAGINFDFTGSDSFGIDLVFQQEAETEFGFFIDAYGLAEFVADGPDLDNEPDIPLQINDDRVVIRDPLNAVELVAESLASVNLQLDVDLSTSEVVVNTDTNVDLDIRVDEDDLDLGVKVGAGSLFVQDGSIIIDGDGDASTDDFLNIRTDFSEFVLTDTPSVTVGSGAGVGGGDFEVDLVGRADIQLPLFQNASNSSALASAADAGEDGEPINFQFDVADLIEETPGSVSINDPDNLPDLRDLVESGLNALLSDPSLLIDGLDNVLSAIQTALQLQLDALGAIPLIGEQIQDAIQPFFDDLNQARIDLNDFLLDEYAKAVTATDGAYVSLEDPSDPDSRVLLDLPLMLREALYDLFAGSGDQGSAGITDGNNDGEGPRLGLLQDLASDGNANVGFEDILLNTFNDVENDDEGVQYDFHIGQSYSISLPFDIGLGFEDYLPGIGFNTSSDEGVTVDVSWDLRLGFGISTQDLFYINTVHFEDISDAGSDYAEELQLAVDVSVPGFEAEVGLGLVGATVTDGVEANATISTTERIPINFEGIEGGEFILTLFSDEYNDDGTLRTVDTTGKTVTFDVDPKAGFSLSNPAGPLTAATALLADLNIQGFGDILVIPDLSEIELLSPSYGLSFQALDPDVTRIEFEHVSGNNFGLGNVITEQGPAILVDSDGEIIRGPEGPVVDANGVPVLDDDGEPIRGRTGSIALDADRNPVLDAGGNIQLIIGDPVFETIIVDIENQYEDARATGLGFANGQTATGGVIVGEFEAPTAGVLNQDVLFTLVVNGEDVEVSVRANSLNDEVDNPDEDGIEDNGDETVDGLDAFVIQVQEALDLALGEAGLAEGLIEISATAGSDTLTLSGAGLQSIEFSNDETSFASLKFAVDLFGDVPDEDEDTPFDPLYDFVETADGIINTFAADSEEAPNLDRPRLTLPELVSSPQTSIYVTLDGDAEIRLHVETNTNNIDDFIQGVAGFPTFGLPSIEFDLKAGAQGSLILFGQVDPDMPAEESKEFSFDDVDFDNIQIDLGGLINSFLGPALDGINTVLGPVFDLVGDGAESAQGFLNAPIPIISDIAGLLGISDDFSFLDLTGNKTSFNAFFDAIEQISRLTDAIDAIADTGKLNLGGLRIVLDDESPFYFPKFGKPVPIAVANVYDNASTAETSLLQLLGITADGSPIPDPGGFKLDLLSPGNIFKLLTGDSFDIFSFNLPKLELELGIDLGFDFDVLAFNIDGGVSVTVDLGIGYDSTGLERIKQAQDEGTAIDGADLLDGFFIRTIEGGGPEISFDASFSGGGSVDIHTPSFCIDLGFLGSACFPRFDIFVVQANLNADFSLALDIIDPNEDGKLRFNEILDVTNGFSNPENALFLFDIIASGGGSFNAGGTILGVSLSTSDLGLDSLNPRFSISAQEIFGGLGFNSPFVPVIAEVLTTNAGSTGIIRINAGEFAYDRIYGDTDDSHGADISVRNINAGTLRFTDNTSGNFTDVSTAGISSIVFRGVDARDILDASQVTSNISFDVRGNGGNDFLRTGSGSDVILGGNGQDFIDGRAGSDSLFGERGADDIRGGSSTDLIAGGQGNDSLQGELGGDRYLFLSTADERNGFGQDTIIESSAANTYADGRVLAISSVQQRGANGIQVTSEGHGLSTGQTVIVTGVVGISNANGTVTVTRIDDDNFTLNGRNFVGGFDGSLGGGYIVDTNVNNLDATRSPAFNLLTDTVDLTNATSSQSLLFDIGSDGSNNPRTTVSFVEEEVAVNTITHNGTGIETFLGGAGNDTFDLSYNTHFTNLDGIEGSDKYIVRLGDNLTGDINVQDTGLANATDSLFVFGRDDVLIPDAVGLTSSEILFNAGTADEKSIAYSPVVNGARLESGLEVIQIDLLQGDDSVNIESTPSESTVTINGGLGSDVFNVGVNASTGAEQNLNLIDGTEENGPLKLFGNDENPAVAENATDLDQLEIFDTTDAAGNNAANNNAGILGFNADTGIGSLEGLGVTIAVEFGGVETVELTLGLGDDELLVLGAVNTDGRTTTGLTTINASTGKDKVDLSLATGSVVTVNGEENNDQINLLASADADIIINGDAGDDEINVTALSALASVAVQGGVGRDTVNFGSTRSSADQGQGSVDGIDGMITVQGGADLDTLNVDDSADTAGNNAANGDAGVVTSSSVTGLGMANGIGSYTDFEQVYVYTGSGADEVNVQSTDVDAVTLVDTNAGDDEIQVSSNAMLTGNLDNVQGDLVIHGGNGNNALLISDLSSAMADANVIFDEGDFDPLRPYIVNDMFTANVGLQNHHFITGLAGQATAGVPFTTGTIYYSGKFNAATGDFRGQDASKGGVTVFAGDQGNSFQINSVHANNLTTLYTGDGNDTVITAALSDTVNAGSNPTADGELLIYGEDGDDIVDASLSDINVTLDGGNDDDILFSGNANDLIVGGDGDDYIDAGDGQDVIFGDSSVTLDLDAQIITRTTNATGGNDFLIGAGGADEIHGELGDDVIFGDNASSVADPVSGEIISATSDPNGGLTLSNASSAQANGVVRITSSGGIAGQDEIFGNDGDDIIIGGLDEDSIQGNAGEDTIFGDNATAMFAADMGVSRPLTVESTDTDQGGNDTIFGDSYTEDPTLTDLGLEDAQNDTDGASDVIFGGIGDDQINAQAGDDIVFGDNGIVHFDDASAQANDLLSTAENDFGADTIHSGVGDDVVIADHGDVTRDDMEEVTRVEATFLTGADDIVTSGDDNDIVVGGGGSDEIDSGAGNDIVLGDFGTIEGNATQVNSVETSDSNSGGMDIIVDSSGNNIIAGGADNDNITTGSGNDIILGDSGSTNGRQTDSADTGVGGSDTISTSGGNNQIIGGAQGDQITSGNGNDVIIGDSGSTDGSDSESVDSSVGGSDTISTSGGNNQIIGGAQGDQITSGSGNDAIIGDSGSTNGSQTQSTDPSIGGSDVIVTSGGNNQIIGGANGDRIQSGSGNDAILGDSGSTNGRNTQSDAPTIGGDDDIQTAGGNNQIIGGVGSDDIQSGGGRDQVLGDNGSIDSSSTTSSSPSVGGNDDISTGGGNDQVVAGAGNDTVDSGGGNDAVIGDNGTTNGSVTRSTEPSTGGSDAIRSTSGNNQIIGGAAGDNITTGGGQDNILGDNGTVTGSTVTSASPTVGGNDRIESGGGNDKIVAGIGDDTVQAGAGADGILGDNGRITENQLQTTQQTIGGNDNLNGGSGNDDILGGFGNDFIDGGSDDDILLGDNGRITYSGNTIEALTEGRFIGGNDFIRGSAGNDVLIGGFGSDILDGSLSEDILIGDNGRVVLGVRPNGERFVISIDAFGTGALDPNALRGLFAFDDDRTDGLLFDLSKDIGVNPVDGEFASSDQGQQQNNEPRRIAHHHVPLEEPIEESESQEEGDLQGNPVDTIEVEKTEIESKSLDSQLDSQETTNTTLLEATVDEFEGDADVVAYMGAASLALTAWSSRTRSAKPEAPEEAMESYAASEQKNGKRMAFDFESSAFVSE
ncbi:MAG: DUF4347 domain-containing protein [Arenicella sp.]